MQDNRNDRSNNFESGNVKRTMNNSRNNNYGNNYSDNNYDSYNASPRPQGNGAPRPQGQGMPRPQGSGVQRPQGQGMPRPQGNGASRPLGQGQPRPQGNGTQRPQGQGQPRPQGNGTQRPQGQGMPRPQGGGVQRPQGQARPQGQGMPRPQGAGAPKPRGQENARMQNPKKRTVQKNNSGRKKRKVALFALEIVILLVVVAGLWVASKTSKIQKVVIDDGDVTINEEVKQLEETGAMKGYRNIALFGVDSRDNRLDKNTRTDTIMIASINQDTKEVRLVSVYRDTWLNMSTDSYSKANHAYAYGGAKQAISMLNMNLDMNITDFITVSFEALIDVIDAVGGIEIDVHEEEISHLNNYQISIVGKEDGTLNAAGEPNYVAEAGVDYIPVTKAGNQKLNGLQATAYCRIRYVGNDFARTSRQRTVLMKIAQKAITINPVTLNNIAEAVFPKIATSLDLGEILELLTGVAGYTVGENSAFPFEGYIQTGRVKGASVVIPVDLTENVKLLHKFFFDDTENYEPSETVKKCSEKIAQDSGVRYNP